MSEPVILGSENPSADVLVYDKDVAYFAGVITDENDDAIVDENGNDLTYEYVGTGV